MALHRSSALFAATFTLYSSLFVQIAQAQQKKPGPIAPAEKLDNGWEEIDQRLVFLMVRLANTETSLDAINKVIDSSSRKKSMKSGEGKRAGRQNEEMDRRGGGPVRWSIFYGTTAEKFFYHPTDRNTTYHTETVLSQQGSQADNKVGGGVPASQGLPIHQRPPQFDYIYRANEKAKERAEADAAELRGRIEELTERRHRLEAEQAGLWCEIAFRAVSHYDLDKKPLYRFKPLLVSSDTDSRLRADSMEAASSFMALALSIISEAEKDQATTFSKIKPAVSQARQNLNDAWLRLAIDVTDRKAAEGRFAALAKRLDDVASNLSDSYVVAMEGDQAKDQQRKDTFRGLLQESLVNYAQIILALDEMSGVMKNEWRFKPDVDQQIQFVSLASVEAVRPVMRSETPLEAPAPPAPLSPDTKTDKNKTAPSKQSSNSSRLKDGRFDIQWESGPGYILEVKQDDLILHGDTWENGARRDPWPKPLTMSYVFDKKRKIASADFFLGNGNQERAVHFEWNVSTGEAFRKSTNSAGERGQVRPAPQ